MKTARRRITLTAHLLGAAAVAIVLAGCADEQTTSPAPAVAKIVSTAPLASSAAPEGDAIAAFHAKNYADWVGKAHNRALDDFFARFAHRAPKNLCAELVEFMSEPERVPPEKLQGTTREQRRAYAIRGLGATQVCRDQLADNGSSTASFSFATVAGVSAAANSLLDQISSAQTTATTASGLAASLTPILSQADQLVSGERDLVYSVASVAQSSFEYWLANIGSLSLQVDATYGPCLGLYSYESHALSSCMGIQAAPIMPTGYRNPGNMARIIFAQSTGCNVYVDGGAIVGWDFAGAVSGGAWGLIGGPGGVLLGAINAGGFASASESWYQFGRWAYCRARGGGGGGTALPIKQT